MAINDITYVYITSAMIPTGHFVSSFSPASGIRFRIMRIDYSSVHNAINFGDTSLRTRLVITSQGIKRYMPLISIINQGQGIPIDEYDILTSNTGSISVTLIEI